MKPNPVNPTAAQHTAERPDANGMLAHASADAPEFLTVGELVKRWRGTVTKGTLANWRSLKIGPAFTKMGREPLYPLVAVQAYERMSLVPCVTRGDRT